MELSSPRFKALAVTVGFSFWFFIITSAAGLFSIIYFVSFVVIVFVITQLLSIKIGWALDAFALFNTRLFLGIVFVFMISIYGVIFKILKIDLLRLRTKSDSYWLEMEELDQSRILKQC